jgi:16S rRNA (uracil1498-N3)-methyltransferase
MHRFYIAPGNTATDKLELTGGEAHHAARVLRVRPGEEVQVLNGAGFRWLCTVSSVHRDSVSLEVIRKEEVPAAACEVTLVQAIPKGKIVESIIQKATELGARRVVPILSERVVTHLDDDSAQDKQEKWQQVAIEAVKQCGAGWLPEVQKPVTPSEFLAQKPIFDLSLVASLRPGSRAPRHVFSAWQSEHGRQPGSVAVWVGPEGDFSSAEYDLIEESGARPISLGSLVLRVETAAIYCLSVIHHEIAAGR